MPLYAEAVLRGGVAKHEHPLFWIASDDSVIRIETAHVKHR